MRFLVAALEPAAARQRRRDSAGAAADEDFAATLARLQPGAEIVRARPIDGDGADPADFDAVFLTGSPINLYCDSPEVRRVVEFTRAVFASGTPSWGSCAGLQAAVVAAGGTVRHACLPERGLARNITRADGAHPMLDGRPDAWDAPAVHTDEVDALPGGARLLATNGACEVQAVEIVQEGGIFWGTQYHPEISLYEIAAALRRQAEELVKEGLARDEAAVEHHAAEIETLHADRTRTDLGWRLGLSAEVTDDERRTRELRNFVEHLVRPAAARRGRC